MVTGWWPARSVPARSRNKLFNLTLGRNKALSERGKRKEGLEVEVRGFEGDSLNRVGRMAPPLACTVLNLCHSYSFPACIEARKRRSETLKEAAHALV